jgi:rubrerythrin
MVGAICKAEILAHPLVTIDCFGWAVFFRAVFAGRDETFLSLLNKAGIFRQPKITAPEFIDHCIALERRAMRIYQSLAARYARQEPARDFFDRLAREEDIHAQLLELCRAAAFRGRWKDQGIETWRQAVPATERILHEAEVALKQPDALADSLRLVIRIESSQINGLFTTIVRSTDALFTKVFGVFRTAVRDHLGFIRERISDLEPRLKLDCDRLQVTF